MKEYRNDRRGDGRDGRRSFDRRDDRRRDNRSFDDRREDNRGFSDGEYDPREGYIEGRNGVTEALRAERPLDKVFIAKGDTDAGLHRLAAMARDAGAVVVETDRRRLDTMSATGAHQGIIAVAAVKEYVTLEEILKVAEDRGEAPFIIVCDEVSDPHNLGAIIRTAEAAGAHGVIIPKRRSAGITGVISKTSAGAVEHMAVARVPNITAALKELKEHGVWVYGTAADGESPLWKTDMKGAVAIVIGSEGDGMSRLVAEECDFKISIPMVGKVSSLNASASAAIVIYEAMKQRINS